MTRARDDRRRNNRAAFIEAFTRAEEFTDRAAEAIYGLLAYDAEARGHYVKEVPDASRVGVEVTPTPQ